MHEEKRYRKEGKPCGKRRGDEKDREDECTCFRVICKLRIHMYVDEAAIKMQLDERVPVHISKMERSLVQRFKIERNIIMSG